MRCSARRRTPVQQIARACPARCRRGAGLGWAVARRLPAPIARAGGAQRARPRASTPLPPAPGFEVFPNQLATGLLVYLFDSGPLCCIVDDNQVNEEPNEISHLIGCRRFCPRL